VKRSAPINAYPLAWPPGWPRTAPEKRERAKFVETTLARSLAFLEEEVRRLGGKNLVLSSNYTLGRAPDDVGVCAYFEYQEAGTAIPCDRWTRVEDNLHAIAKTIEALRGIERWGAKHMVKAAFTGFAALPAPGQTNARSWREVMEFGPGEIVTKETLERAYRRLRSTSHPDKGGTTEAFNAVQAAFEQGSNALANSK